MQLLSCNIITISKDNSFGIFCTNYRNGIIHLLISNKNLFLVTSIPI